MQLYSYLMDAPNVHFGMDDPDITFALTTVQPEGTPRAVHISSDPSATNLLPGWIVSFFTIQTSGRVVVSSLSDEPGTCQVEPP